MPVNSTPIPGPEHTTPRRSWLAGFLLMALIGVGVVFPVLSVRLRVPATPVHAEYPVSELERVDGVWRLRAGAVPVTGWIVDHLPAGGLKFRSFVREGRLDGLSEGWHTNGQVQVREHFRGGVAEGPVGKWHPNGVKASEGTAREGRLEGEFSRWHDNGTLSEQFRLVSGQPHGIARAWFPSGHQKAETELDHGKVVRHRFWPDGEGPRMETLMAGKVTP